MAVKRHRTHYDVTAENRTDAAMNAVERNMKKVDGAAAAMGRTFRAVLGATAVIALTREIGRAAIEAEKSQNRLTAVMRATGGVAGVTRREIEALSESLSRSTMFDDEGIRNAAAELVKFGNIHGNVFRDGLALSADLASFMGTDIPQAAQMVGRALQSPTEGMRLLERQFGRLTDEEEKHIETLAAQGRAVEAQNAVLELMRRKIGDTAKEMNTGLTKATGDLGKAWNDALEAIGRSPAITDTAASGFGVLTGQLRALKRVVEDGNWVELLFGSKVAGLFEGGGALNRASGVIRNMGLEGAVGLEESLAATPRVPVTLGGSVTDKGAEARKRRQEEIRKANEKSADEFAKSMAAGAEEAQEFADSLIFTWDGVGNRIELTKQQWDGMNQRMEESAGILANVFAVSAEEAVEAAENLVFTWDAAGNRTTVTLEKWEEGVKKLDDAALDLGFTFASAFEDAVLEGEKLRDVVQGLAKDIARIILRQAVTVPVANAVSGAFAGLFSGAGASYTGNLAAFAEGTDYVPRTGLALVHQGEAIIPAGRNGAGGITIVQNLNFSANTPAASRDALMAAAPILIEQAKRAVFDARARGQR